MCVCTYIYIHICVCIYTYISFLPTAKLAFAVLDHLPLSGNNAVTADNDRCHLCIQYLIVHLTTSLYLYLHLLYGHHTKKCPTYPFLSLCLQLFILSLKYYILLKILLMGYRFLYNELPHLSTHL